MRQIAQGTLAALVALVGLTSVANAASTCTVQYAQRSEPSTDDSIGICLDKMLWLSIYEGSSRQHVNEISYVYKTAESNCNIDSARLQSAIDTLKAQAAQLQSEGACAKVELLL